jgi:hypothetical protein
MSDALQPQEPEIRGFHDRAVDCVAVQLVTEIKVLRAIIDAMTKTAHEREQRIEFLENTMEYLWPRKSA